MGPRLKLPPYVHGFIDRNGKPRFYFRRRSYKSLPLPGLPWSPTFMSAYETVMHGEPPVRIEIGSSRTTPGTVKRRDNFLFQLQRFPGARRRDTA